MGISVAEQETVIRFDRDSSQAVIYTSDSTAMTKLHKLLEKSGTEWKLTDVDRMDGEIIGETYSCPKKLISLRARTTHRAMTEEQRKEATERLRKARTRDSTQNLPLV